MPEQFFAQHGDEIRPATQQEIDAVIEARQLAARQVAAIESRAAALASARTKLAALGLTHDEVVALLG